MSLFSLVTFVRKFFTASIVYFTTAILVSTKYVIIPILVRKMLSSFNSASKFKDLIYLMPC